MAAQAETRGFTVMFAPFTHENGAFGKVARGEASLINIEDELTGGVFTPPTDARPFFFEMTEGLPWALVDAWIAVGVVLALAAVGLAFAVRRTMPRAVTGQIGVPLVYFAALGLAFLLVEISLLARLTLFIGQPTLALIVALAALLVAAGAGSLLSGRFTLAVLHRVVTIAAATAAILSVAVPWITESFQNEAAQLPFIARIALATAAIVPLGVAMGILFLSGLQLVRSDAALPWAISGVASVVGSVLATTIAIETGYPVVSIAAALIYTALALGGTALLRRATSSSDAALTPAPSNSAPSAPSHDLLPTLERG